MAGGEPTRVVVSDSSVLINFINIDRLNLLGALPGFDFVIPDHVEAEITQPEQKACLAVAIEAGHLKREAMTDLTEIGVFAELTQVMGKGEAACLAMAKERGWWIAADERGRFLRQVRERLGEARLLNTPGILLKAIRANVLTVAEADKLKAELERHRFKMKFGSFGELLGMQS